ncbi:hypothetical protein [Sneathiella glossodoripedis]|uniref:hypothetical protein n=1 Tax=Sneathiella glossodoripedis TaxID=418853 RepID=UPI00131ED8D6|nr:hypothetical protein [Sneathiella glossodoripedis]
MASTLLSKEKQAIAQNLIDTCGLQRAFHAAQQFGWHDIATSISEKLEQNNFPNTRH